MQQNALVLDPLLDARDIIESYLRSGSELENWRTTLQMAAERLATVAAATVSDGARGAEVERLAANLQLIVGHGLDRRLAAVQDASRQLVSLLEQSRVAGLPAPGDDDWSF